MIRKDSNMPKRNDACPCGSGAKFKKCCGGSYIARHAAPRTGVTYIDSGEEAIRWVICDLTGTRFFSNAANQILVFADKAVATAIVALEEFANQAPGEINVAAVGPTKFQHLCNTLPYVEVADVEHAVALVRERIAVKTQEEGVNDGDKGQEENAQQEDNAAADRSAARGDQGEEASG